MLRRLHPEQPDSFAFTPANQAWAEEQMKKYPEGRQASAIIPLLWRAQEQEGWLTRPAIEGVADMLGMPYIRALEVATFYFMFQLQPVGSVAHVQVCGTTTCMICGAEDLIAVCKEKIANAPHELSADGKLSWEEVECLGACANAPMAQIGKDYYEDLTAESFAQILDDLAAGKVPTPGPQNGRYGAEPASGLTSLKDHEAGRPAQNASVALATSYGDTVKRIDGTEQPLPPGEPLPEGPEKGAPRPPEAKPAEDVPASDAGVMKQEAEEVNKARPVPSTQLPGQEELAARKGDWRFDPQPDTPAGEARPAPLDGPRGGTPDDLKAIKGIGPKLEAQLHDLGIYHFDQIASWGAAEIAWMDNHLEGFQGRVTRDDWVAQAKEMSNG